MTKEVSKLRNPFDFANPVASKELFSGRSGQLREIRYYLDQASTARRPINLALLGKRAAGKTSLLNMIGILGRDREFCVARVDLNESDVTSSLHFFAKVFDEVFGAACDHRPTDPSLPVPFGGKGARTYEAYIDMISSYTVPQERLFCPFVFPVQVARALGAGNHSALISEQALRSDLKKISDEVGRTILVLFDECNVLSSQRAILEMLRNLFMNLPGYMLVFSGTEELFPVMDEVFSPIVRQFKKIVVLPFESRNETSQCISAHLESLSLNDDEIYRSLVVPHRTVDEVHRLAAGRPYEVQLLCHFMFRRLQLGFATTMVLDLDVLDDVLNELQQGANANLHPVLSQIRRLETRSLEALQIVMSWRGLTLDNVASVEYTLNGISRWGTHELQQVCDGLAHAGLVSSAGALKFLGDEFDTIYAKYYALSKGVDVGPFDDDMAMNFMFAFISGVHEGRWSSLTFGHVELTPDDELGVDDLAGVFADPGALGRMLSIEGRTLGLSAYSAIVDAIDDNRSSIRLVLLRFSSGWLDLCAFVGVRPADDNEDIVDLVALQQSCDHVVDRAKQMGFAMTIRAVDVNVPTMESLCTHVIASASAAKKVSLARIHYGSMLTAYTEVQNLPLSAEHGLWSLKYHPEVASNHANNMAYLFMALERFVDAVELLIRAMEGAAPDSNLLPGYNLAVCLMALDRIPEAQVKFTEIRRQLTSGAAPPVCVCLFVPRFGSNGMELEELRNPDFGTALEEAINQIAARENKDSPA